MSEHIQQAPGPHAAHPPGTETHERTPGVMRESDWFNFRLIIKVGIGLALTALVIHFAVWYLLRGLDRREKQPTGEVSSLALQDARRPLGQRLDNVPPPHLEGIERESTLLILRVDDDREERFYVSPQVKVHLGKNKDARLFELREGQPVTIAYHMPGGVAGGVGVITTVTAPPEKSDSKARPELPEETRTLTGTVTKLEPRSIEAARQWAEVQMHRTGWTDQAKGVVHIPVEQAMEEVLNSKEFRTEEKKKKSEGHVPLPTRSSSGREARGGSR